MSESCFVRLLKSPYDYLSSNIRSRLKTEALGNLLQKAAFMLTLALFSFIWLPQFASDKEGLALISLTGLILYIAGRALGGAEKRKPTSIDAIVLLFFGAHIVSAFASHYFIASLKGLAKVFIYVCSYFLFTSVATTPRRRLLLLLAVVTGGLAASVYGLYQYKIGVLPLATWEDPSVENKATRIYSTLGNPNLLAGYLVPIIPISACLAIFCLVRKKFVFFLPLLAATAIILAACVLTGSRGGYIGIAADLGLIGLIMSIFLWRQIPKSRPFVIALWVLAPVALVAAIHMLPSLEQRVLSLFQGREHSSNAYRMYVWTASWQMFIDNWWFGSGVGNQAFRLAYGLYMTSGFDALGTYCVPLEIAVETGIVGLTIFALFLAALFARAHRAFWRSESGDFRFIYMACAVGIAGMMAHGLGDTVFYRPQVHFIFWLLCALVVADDPEKQLRDESQ